MTTPIDGAAVARERGNDLSKQQIDLSVYAEEHSDVSGADAHRMGQLMKFHIVSRKARKPSQSR
jgi:hypothetical protein